MTTVTDGSVTDHGAAGLHPATRTPQLAQDGAVERALAAAVRDGSQIGALLDELSRGRLWVPLPEDGPVTDGSAVLLPTVRYLGSEFVPAFTSAARLRECAAAPPGGEPPAVVPHVVVRAADLARLLPASLGIALNPGAGESVPVYPEGVAYLAGPPAGQPGQVSIGPAPAEAAVLLDGVAAGLAGLPFARSAAAAWLSVEQSGAGLVISVLLDDPLAAVGQQAVIAVIEASAAAQQAAFPIDVTFPGEGEPDQLDRWIAAFAGPFYQSQPA
ncbi:MAG TPA: SseB family protein [Streptosporangiaceae bacterium]